MRQDAHGLPGYTIAMKMTYTAVIERDAVSGLLVGYMPGFAGAHSLGTFNSILKQAGIK